MANLDQATINKLFQIDCQKSAAALQNPTMQHQSSLGSLIGGGSYGNQPSAQAAQPGSQFIRSQ